MANSRKKRPNDAADVIAAVREAVRASCAAAVTADSRLAVGYSGGLDSTVLLDAIAALRQYFPVVGAIHVHHGLSPNANQWAAHCASECAARDLPLTTVRVAVVPAPQQSIEAEARRARYAAFAESGYTHVALAHHADDQTETLLLQLLRGAGVKGLAAMPACKPGSPTLLRPLLGFDRRTLERYAEATGLRWIDDESNADPSFRRNWLRHEWLPKLETAFPGCVGAIGRSAAHCAEAAEMLDEVADGDLAGCSDGASLLLPGWRGLSSARRRNALRRWLVRLGQAAPPAARLLDWERQLTTAGEEAQIRLQHEQATLLASRQRLALVTPAPADFELTWCGEAELALPHGQLVFTRQRGEGFALPDAVPLTVRPRRGGERLQLDPKRPHRTLKNLYQEHDLPNWLREGLPLLCNGDTLVAVPGIGVAAAYRACPDEDGWSVDWQPAHPATH